MLLLLTTTLLGCLVKTSLTSPLYSDNDTSLYPQGDYRRCLFQSNDMNVFEVLPGGGWDNLMNKDRGMVLDVTYYGCKTTEDRKYLLPDSVFTVPNKLSRVDTFAKMFTHWTDYKSVTSTSVNMDVGVVFEEGAVSGSFGDGHLNCKETQIQTKSSTAQVQLRYNRYKSELQPGFPLSSAFKRRLLSIASNIDVNNLQQARYDAQLLVREYGTHVITSIDAGAALVKEDYIANSYLKKTNTDSKTVTASASLILFGLLKFDSSYSHSVTNTDVQGYQQAIQHSKIFTHGGPMFRVSNFSADDWVNDLDNNLVAIDRAGDPLYYFITPESFPEMRAASLSKVRRIMEDAVALYYKTNTYRGCTDPDSPNFSLSANLDDKSCKDAPKTVSFGGVYQTCTLSDQNAGDFCSDQNLQQTNPMTGTYSCPAGFEAVPVTSGTVDKQWTEHNCHRILFWKVCHDISHTSTATYEGFWCSASKPSLGFYFGGVFTSEVNNPFTSAKTCPDFFTVQHLGTDLSVCVSDDGDMGPKNGVPLGGFFSCRTGNPLALSPNASQKNNANEWPQQCPSGYSMHVATNDQGCDVNYCLVSQSFKDIQLKVVRRPPYMKTPVFRKPKHSFSLYDSVSDKWMKNDDAFTFLRANVPAASNLTANDFMMSPAFTKLTPATEKTVDTEFAPSDIGTETMDPVLLFHKMTKATDNSDPGTPNNSTGSPTWVIVLSVVASILIILSTVIYMGMKIKSRRRKEYVRLPNSEKEAIVKIQEDDHQ